MMMLMLWRVIGKMLSISGFHRQAYTHNRAVIQLLVLVEVYDLLVKWKNCHFLIFFYSSPNTTQVFFLCSPLTQCLSSWYCLGNMTGNTFLRAPVSNGNEICLFPPAGAGPQEAWRFQLYPVPYRTSCLVLTQKYFTGRNWKEPPAPPCNLSSGDDWAIWNIVIISHYQMGSLQTQGFKNSAFTSCVLFLETPFF